MKNPVLVASFPDEVSWLLAAPVARAGTSVPQCVGLLPDAQAAFRTAGLECSNTIPYLDSSAHHSVFVAASQLAQHWFRGLPPSVLDLLTHESICFPELLQYDASFLFTEVLLHIEMLRAILERERPDPLVIAATHPRPVTTRMIGPDERFLFSVAQQLCASAGVWLHAVPPAPAAKPARPSVRVPVGWTSIRDIFTAIGIEPSPLKVFWSYALPQALGRGWWGKAVHGSLLRAYARSPRKLVFWGEMRSKIALYERLRAARDTGIIVLTDDDRLRFKRFLVPRVDPRNLARQESVRAAVRERAEQAWSAICADKEFQNLLCYSGMGLWPLLAPRLAYYVTEYFPACVEFLEATKDFVRRYGGDVLVSCIDVYGFTPWLPRAFSAMGRESLYLWHGLTVPNAVTEEGLRPVFLPLNASRMGAFGSAIRDWYVRMGTDPARIQVVGFPDIGSDFQPLPEARRRRICRKLGLDADKPIVIYAAGITRYGGRRAYSEETADEILRATSEVLSALGAEPSWQLVLKLHPGMTAEERAPLYAMAREFPNVRVWQMPSLTQMLRGCDLLITYQSSAGIEALAHGRDVLIYNTTGRANQFTPYCMRLDDAGANFMILVDRREELAPVVSRLLRDQDLRARLRRQRAELDPLLLANWDGRAAERALALLDECCAGKLAASPHVPELV